MAILLQFGHKNFTFRNVNNFCQCGVNAIGKQPLKKNVPFERKILLSYSKEHGAQNNNKKKPYL